MKKFLLTAGTTLSMLYWGAMPVMAETVSLCGQPPYASLCTGTEGVTVPKLVGIAINLLFFASFVLALGYLIYGGIKWIMSGGDKEGTAKAKSAVTAALIGLAIVLGSYILINLVMQFFGMTGGFSNLYMPSLTNIKANP